MKILENDRIDLIIEMLSIGDVDTFELARQLKEKHPRHSHCCIDPFLTGSIPET